MSLSEPELRRAGAPADSVRLPPESESESESGGGGYLAYLASHHHLHCLYLLHQSLHADYYAGTGAGMWALSAERRLSHWDHCVEALRQYVVCEADATVVTHSWFEGYDEPVASQENPRRCADWDAHFRWQLDRQAAAPLPPPTEFTPGKGEGEGEGKGGEGREGDHHHHQHEMWSLKKPPGAVERPVLPVDPPPGAMEMYLPV